MRPDQAWLEDGQTNPKRWRDPEWLIDAAKDALKWRMLSPAARALAIQALQRAELAA